MPVVTESSTIAEHIKLRRPRNHLNPDTPNPPIPCCKSVKKKTNFSSATFRGLGCTAAAPSHVSVPAAIRASADWDGKKMRKKKNKKKKKQTNEGSGSGGCMVAQDLWCGPGIGFSTDSASVDCVVARRKIDGENMTQTHRERSSCLAPTSANPRTLSYLDLDSDPEPEPAFVTNQLRGRCSRHVPYPFAQGLAQVLLLQSNILMGGRLNSHDQFSNWRLDVDNMTYEELLELGERIGYVSTGLKEDEIVHCVTKTKIINNQKTKHLDDLSTELCMQNDLKCSICQEECEETDEMGKLECGHIHHLQCIKQWLLLKNTCPVCKAEARG